MEQKPRRTPEYKPCVLYPTPQSTSRQLWHTEYYEEIYALYQIYRAKLEELYPDNQVNWDDIKLYNDFSRLLYQTSSKYILK